MGVSESRVSGPVGSVGQRLSIVSSCRGLESKGKAAVTRKGLNRLVEARVR